jgi:hypothetical protein
MAITHSETIKGSGSGTGPTTGSMTSSGAELWLLSVLVFDAGGAVTITADLDGTTGMTQDRSQLIDVAGGNPNEEQIAVFSLANVASGSHSVSISFGGINVDSFTWFLSRFAGAATSSPVDGTGASTSGSGTTAASGTFTTTNSDGMFYGAMMSDSGSNPATVTALDSWTIPTNGSETNGSVNVVAGVSYLLNPGTTSGNARYTVDSAGWGAMGIGYKVAAVGRRFLLMGH